MKKLILTLLCAAICMPFMNVNAQDAIGEAVAVAAPAKVKCGDRKNVSTNLQRVCINAASAAEAKTKYEARALTIANITCDASDCQLSSDKCEPYFAGWQGGATTPEPTPNADSTKWCFAGNSNDYRVGCTECTADLAVFEGTVHREGADPDEKFMLMYPNPADRQVWIEIQSAVESQLQITVMNSQGKKVLDAGVFKLIEGLNVHQINTESLTPGLYFVMMMQEGVQLETQQLVIQ
ncbi:MAG: T9SS type A sorting domain-containing protein [Bacteroidia bacterium]